MAFKAKALSALMVILKEERDFCSQVLKSNWEKMSPLVLWGCTSSDVLQGFRVPEEGLENKTPLVLLKAQHFANGGQVQSQL